MAEDYVSMHHRIRRSLRRRLKHVSAEIERPVTDIVNKAIETWLNENGSAVAQETSQELDGASAAEKVAWLRGKKAEGRLYAAASSMGKSDLVEVIRYFNGEADLRMSGDRLVTELVKIIC